MVGGWVGEGRGDSVPPSHLQPGERDVRDATDKSPAHRRPTDPVHEHELRAIEEENDKARRAAENLARLEKDWVLYREMADEGFEGPVWLQYAEELCAYGIEVITAWMVTGEMFAKATQRGRGVGQKPREFNRDDCEDVAQEVLVRGIRHFQDYALRRCKWDPSKGASMRTYFIGGCISQFSNAYHAWRDKEAQPVDPSEALLHANETIDVASQVTRAATIESALTQLRPADRAIIELYRNGYEHQEIADAFGMPSAAAATERIRRIVRNLASRTEDDRGSEAP